MPNTRPFSRLRRRLLTGALAGASLTACSPIALVNGLTPREGYSVRDGLPYGANERERYDLYLPDRPHALAPRVVFFYGGAWTMGRREDYLFVGEALASAGCLVAIPDYRLYPEVRYPAFLSDCARAVAAVHAEDAWRKAGGPLVLMGHSAGAYNAAMLAYSPPLLAAAGFDRIRIAGFVGLAGPYDFLPLTGRTTRAVFGHPDTSPLTQPITHVDGGAPPSLLLAAERDSIVDPGNSARLAARLSELGRPVRHLRYPQLDHRTLVGALSVPLRDRAPVRGDILAFLQGLSA